MKISIKASKQLSTYLKLRLPIIMVRNNQKNQQDQRVGPHADKPVLIEQSEEIQLQGKPPMGGSSKNQPPKGGKGGKGNFQKFKQRTGLQKTGGVKQTDPNAFKPKMLSTQSHDRNDPHSDFPSIASLGISAEVVTAPTFKLDYSQYMVLIGKSYQVITGKDRGFSKYVSQSMYNYYFVIELWRRIMNCKPRIYENQEADLLGFNSRWEADKLPMFKDLNTYLKGIGNFIDYEGHKSLLTLHATPGYSGYLRTSGAFGRVSAETHLAYETMPAPIVCLIAIQEDMRYTQALAGNPDPAPSPYWDLPDVLRPERPEGDPAVIPTANLLGWKPSSRLTAEQGMALVDAGFEVDVTFNATLNSCGIPINSALLDYVADKIHGAKVDCRTDLTLDTEGTNSVIPHTRISSADMDYVRSKIFSSRVGSIRHPNPSSSNLITAAQICRYRIKRHTEDTSPISHCYVIPPTAQAAAAPIPGWNANSDDVWNAVPSGWNREGYRTVESDGGANAHALSASFFRE